MPEETYLEKQEEKLSVRIFASAAGMSGVCLTTIGLLNLAHAVQKIRTFADEILALDAVMFLSASIISYLAIRTRSRQRRLALERIADWIFLFALAVIVVACVIVALMFA